MVEDYWKLKPLATKKVSLSAKGASFKSNYWGNQETNYWGKQGTNIWGAKPLGIGIKVKSLGVASKVSATKLHFNLDTDRDGVSDWKDCSPFNPKRQDNQIGSFLKKRKEKKKSKEMAEAEKTVARVQKKEQEAEAPKEEPVPIGEEGFKIKEHKVTPKEQAEQAIRNIGVSVGQLKKFGKKISSSKAFAESGIKREAKIRGTTEEEIEKIVSKASQKRALTKEELEKLKFYEIKQEREAKKQEILAKISKTEAKFARGPSEFPKTPIAGRSLKYHPGKAGFPTEPQEFQREAAEEIVPVYQLPKGPEQVPYTSRLTPTIKSPKVRERIKKGIGSSEIFPQRTAPTAFELLRAEEMARRELGIQKPLPPAGGVNMQTGEPMRVPRYGPITLRQSFVVNPFVKKPDIEAPEFGQTRPSGRKIGDSIFSSMTKPTTPPQGPFGTSRVPGQLMVSNLAPRGERTQLSYSTLSPKGGRSPLPWTNLEPKKGIAPFKFITFDFRKQQGLHVLGEPQQGEQQQ